MKERSLVGTADFRSYYGRPILKRPVWKWFIPAYFFTGGLSGASATLALGAQLTRNRALRRTSRLVSLAGIVASTFFLVIDLGRPSRFHHMLRVARPTSPMSMGSWLLALFGPATGAAAMSEATGLLTGVGDAAGAVAGVLGPAVATYTGVLVADSAIPAWHEARDHLPLLFAGGAAASAGGVAMPCVAGDAAEPARRLAIAGAQVELGASRAMEQHLGPVGEPYHAGVAGRIGKVATQLTMAGAVALGFGRRRPWASRLGGALVVVGAAAERFAVFQAGVQSAADPKYVVATQRERMAKGESASDPSSGPTTPSPLPA
jgi:formate-dependent nitrite reductase membrane component NrfD